jgi:hypothetical protein
MVEVSCWLRLRCGGGLSGQPHLTEGKNHEKKLSSIKEGFLVYFTKVSSDALATKQFRAYIREGRFREKSSWDAETGWPSGLIG